MKKTIKKGIFEIILTMLILSIIYYVIDGIPLAGLPKEKDVSYIEIYNASLDDIRICTESEDIEKCIKIVYLLNYKLGTPKQGSPLITITYHLKDGKKLSVSANENTVYWKGKAHTIKDDNGDFFVDVIEGMFFDRNENIG